VVGSSYSNGSEPFSVRQALAGKHVFVTGTTGFVGKVVLALLIAEVPALRRITCLVRPKHGFSSAMARAESEIFASPCLRVALETPGVEAGVLAKVRVVQGDLGFERLALSDEDWQTLTVEDPVDLVLGCAGMVDFSPPLDHALVVNSFGPKRVHDFAQAVGACFVHVSTCFVAGARSGSVLESGEIEGYCPSGSLFDAEAELAAAQRKVEGALEGVPDDLPPELRRKVKKALVNMGTKRAQLWGWTNTYTYSKSIGEQCVLRASRESGVPVALVRPAVVESARTFPIPGWNEGANTSAPIVWLMYKGHRMVPCNPENVLDVVPVDDVARGIVSIGAALLLGRAERVYHLATGDVNPLTMEKTISLTNAAWNRHYTEQLTNPIQRLLMKNLESMPVSRERFEQESAPRFNRLAGAIREILEWLPGRWLWRPLIRLAKRIERMSGMAALVMKHFLPFIEEHNPIFSTANIRALSDQLVEDEREAFAFTAHEMDWTEYWRDLHLPGLQKWVFAELDAKARGSRRS
jgi:long-chain acyl-CoA synthetase